MSKSLVSIVIPSHNNQKFILQALNSAVAQTYRPLEIVIVDDGSTDSTSALIRQWEKEHEDSEGLRIQTFFRANCGTAESINFGIRKSKGEIIAILNAEDFYAPERIESMTKPIASGKSQFAISLVKFVNSSGEGLEVSDPRYEGYSKQVSNRFQHPSLSMALLHWPLHVSTSNYVFSREIFNRLAGFQNYQWCHDYDFIMRACIHTEPVMVSRHLLSYRPHENNDASSRSKQSEIFDHEVRRILEDYFEEISCLSKSKKKTNIFAPSPYNWPVRFKNTYRNGLPFVKQSNFLSQLSLCNNFVFENKEYEIAEKLNPYLENSGDGPNALRSLIQYHYLHQKNFKHVVSKEFESVKLHSLVSVTNHQENIGTLIRSKAKINFPYYNKLGLLGVFSRDRLVAVLRYDKSQKNVSEFKGFSAERYSLADRTKLKICWLDFLDSTLVCRWPTKPKFPITKKVQKKPETQGHLDFVGVDNFDLKVHGWGLVNRELPHSISLHVNKKKVEVLPTLENRSDLKSLLQNPDSHGAAGFAFYYPLKLLPQTGKLEIAIEFRSGQGNLRLEKILDTGRTA